MRIIKLAATLWAHLQHKRDPISYARSRGVKVGKDCRFLSTTLGTFGSEPYLVTIGNHVTITGGVRFITHDGGVWIFRRELPDIDVFGPIEIGNNVFIGVDAIILPNTKVGDDCVIGAGSVVTSDVPSGTVAAGVPARQVGDVASFRQKSLAKADFIRSRKDSEKQEYLLEKFVRT